MTDEEAHAIDDRVKTLGFEDDDAFRIRFFSPSEVEFSRSGDLLRMTIKGERSCLRVIAMYAFPHSGRDRYISLRDMDGNELGMIRNPGEFERDTRKLLEDELRRRYVTPTILEIKSISDKYEIVEWEVETDRGPKTFVTRSLHDSMTVSAGCLIITDMENNRYEIRNRSQLDPQSEAVLTRKI